MKISQSLLVSKEGSKFWWFLWFPAKNHSPQTFRPAVYATYYRLKLFLLLYVQEVLHDHTFVAHFCIFLHILQGIFYAQNQKVPQLENVKFCVQSFWKIKCSKNWSCQKKSKTWSALKMILFNGKKLKDSDHFWHRKLTLKVRLLQLLTTFTQLSAKSFFSRALLVLITYDGPVKCAKSLVILMPL